MGRLALVTAVSVALIPLAGSTLAAPKQPGATRRARTSVSGLIRPATSLGLARGGEENVAPRSTDPLEAELVHKLDALLGSTHMKSSRNGILVVDARLGRVIYSAGAERQLNPASNVKLVSTAAAIATLGADWTYETKLLGPAPDAAGKIAGDVWLVGSWDPSLRLGDLNELAGMIAARGIKEIAGDVLIGTLSGPSGGRDALARAGLEVTVSGPGTPGAAASVSFAPAIENVTIENRAKISAKKRRGRLTVRVTGHDLPDGTERYVVRVEGVIKPGQRVQAWRAVPKPTLFTGQALRALLRAQGILVKGVRRAEGPPAGLGTLAVHASRPISELIARVNKPSNNWLADRVIWTAGAVKHGGAPSNDLGLRVMSDWLATIGIAPGAYRIDNGSGLSRTNHLSPEQLVQVLLAAGRDQTRTAPDFLASLSVAGHDGTLRGRLRGHASAGWLRGKTGTLNGVATLSGYVTAGGDDSIVFAIMTNGFRNRRKGSVRAVQHQMVDAMHRYLALRYEAKTGLPAPAAPASPLGAMPNLAIVDPEEADEGTLDGTEPLGDAPVLRF